MGVQLLALITRHGRARPGHPRLSLLLRNEDVDARHKAGHDELWGCALRLTKTPECR
jgi:hypothetical protein